MRARAPGNTLPIGSQVRHLRKPFAADSPLVPSNRGARLRERKQSAIQSTNTSLLFDNRTGGLTADGDYVCVCAATSCHPRPGPT
jgi:hypothetical protein